MVQVYRAVAPRAASSPAGLEYDSGMTNEKRKSRVVLAGALLVVAGLSVTAFLLGRGDGRLPSPGPVASGPLAVTEPGVSQSRPPVVDAEPLTAAPQGVTWELFQGVALPTSSTDGPTRIDGPVHAGFSRTPTGALLADMQISSRILVDRQVDSIRRVVQAQLVEGPGKTAYLNLIGQLTENVPPATGYAQIAGFRYITFTPDLAVISRATRDQGGRTQVSTDTVRWVDGDWKLDRPPSGLQQPQVVQDLAGYVPWSGVS